jgi:hypothetical protein
VYRSPLSDTPTSSRVPLSGGAGTGAGGTAVFGGDAGTGALVGSAVGAAAGALTDSNDIDLGDPTWR